MVAADKGYQSIVEALLEGGVDVNYKHQVYGYDSIILLVHDICDHMYRRQVGQLFSLQQRMVE